MRRNPPATSDTDGPACAVSRFSMRLNPQPRRQLSRLPLVHLSNRLRGLYSQ